MPILANGEGSTRHHACDPIHLEHFAHPHRPDDVLIDVELHRGRRDFSSRQLPTHGSVFNFALQRLE